MVVNPLIVIQARLGSKRLPGKILLPLGDRPVLQHVVERCQRTGYPVVVACPQSDLNRIASTRYTTAWVECQDSDVLSRFALLVEYALYGPLPRPDCIVRITADCPLVDLTLIEAAVQAVRKGADYAGNTVERHWPRGCDVECFTTELLQRAHELASDPYDREHVTPWMQRWAASPMALPAAVRPVEARSEWRWCLDRPTDYRWLQGLWGAFPTPTLEQAAAYSRMVPPPVD